MRCVISLPENTDEKLMNFSYERYLENYFRKTFQLAGTPIRFLLREKKKDQDG